MSHWTAAACALLAAAGLARADLVCDRPEHDAGPVRGGVALVHQFTLVNRGKERVEIGTPRAGCGCLRPTVSRASLAPGEAAVVRAEIHTVTQSAGPNAWKMLVPYSEPGQQGEVLLVVRAEVTPEIAIKPATLVLYTDKAMSHPVTLLERRERPVGVRGAATTCPSVQARVTEARHEGGLWTRAVSLDVGPGCPEGRHEHTLVVYTDDANYPELKVPFTVVKRGADTPRATPQELDWKVRAGQPLASHIVTLSSGSDKPVEVERVEASHECLECRFAAGPGLRSTLRVTCDRPPAGGLDGEVRVYLKGPVPGVVRIPVRVQP